MEKGSPQRAAFFKGVHQLFNDFAGAGGPTQIAGLDFLLDEWLKPEQAWLRASLPKSAYVFATAYHETAHTMQPVIETFNLAHDRPGQNPSVETAVLRLENAWQHGGLPWVKTPYWRFDAQHQSWLGRGFVQLTFKTNYDKAAQKTGLSLIAHPELMLQPAPAALVMFRGMKEGWFTGRSLDLIDDRIDGDEFADMVKGRTIINGVDHASAIAQIGTVFLKGFQAGAA